MIRLKNNQIRLIKIFCIIKLFNLIFEILYKKKNKEFFFNFLN